MNLHDIPTPALVVDVAAMQRNIDRMASFYAAGPCRLRPHFKAHKTPEIARRQLAAGSCVGLTCATVGEAEVIVDERITDDILVANEIVGPGKARRVARIAATGVDIKVAVDSAHGLEEIAAAAREEGTEVGILVDVNVGMPRCGVSPGEPALALARSVQGLEGVSLRGVMGYEGHVVGLEDRAEREVGAASAMDELLGTARSIRGAGLPCEIVSAGGTGTYDITGRVEGVTEIQAGSYVLMDTAYAKLGLTFELALSVLGTVLSHPRPERSVADTGHKACSTDHGNPSVKGIEGASVLSLSDEHATIALPPDAPRDVGDRIELWPSHIDPTINLHDVMYALEDDRVVGTWPITARGYAEQRVATSP